MKGKVFIINGGKLSRLQLSQKHFSCSMLENYIKPRKKINIVHCQDCEEQTLNFTCCLIRYITMTSWILEGNMRLPGQRQWEFPVHSISSSQSSSIFLQLFSKPQFPRKQEGEVISACSVFASLPKNPKLRGIQSLQWAFSKLANSFPQR